MLGLSRRALYRRLERLDLGDTISRRKEPALEPPAPSRAGRRGVGLAAIIVRLCRSAIRLGEICRLVSHLSLNRSSASRSTRSC